MKKKKENNIYKHNPLNPVKSQIMLIYFKAYSVTAFSKYFLMQETNISLYF